MPLVVVLLQMWVAIHALASLPDKLPLKVNVLLYMAVAVIDINKFTLLSFTYKLYTVDMKVPEFLAAVLHRDVTFSLAMLAFANAVLTADTRPRKTVATLAVFSYLLATGYSLRWMGVIRDIHWNLALEIALIAAIMGATYLLGAGLMKLWKKETGDLGS
ncbi:hypothetical protein FE782_18215 [Paenibacillus antri]|uniref:Uncharacterized protein n=1 Tax=Paenibacillus antri TaxID=2582848 RepID=A0A5R9GC60_9BACL|nr:hypothetical protein [Paenibacillus antri]TLS50978.1 hypothetical protein FE782_18215 [Paenibacillus antri]